MLDNGRYDIQTKSYESGKILKKITTFEIFSVQRYIENLDEVLETWEEFRAISMRTKWIVDLVSTKRI